jgi:hypothetical protein
VNARQQRLLEAARAQAAADRAAAAAARDRLAAGIGTAIAEVQDALIRVLALPDLTVDELRDQVDGIALELGRLFAGRFLEAAGIDDRDPRIVKGSIAGPGGAYDRGAVIVDTTDALLQDSLTVAELERDPDVVGGRLVALEVGGRINRTTDRHRLVIIGDVDTLASWVTECYALAARGGFTEDLDAAVTARVDAMPAPPEEDPS